MSDEFPISLHSCGARFKEESIFTNRHNTDIYPQSLPHGPMTFGNFKKIGMSPKEQQVDVESILEHFSSLMVSSQLQVSWLVENEGKWSIIYGRMLNALYHNKYRVPHIEKNDNINQNNENKLLYMSEHVTNAIEALEILLKKHQNVSKSVSYFAVSSVRAIFFALLKDYSELEYKYGEVYSQSLSSTIYSILLVLSSLSQVFDYIQINCTRLQSMFSALDQCGVLNSGHKMNLQTILESLQCCNEKLLNSLRLCLDNLTTDNWPQVINNRNLFVLKKSPQEDNASPYIGKIIKKYLNPLLDICTQLSRSCQKNIVYTIVCVIVDSFLNFLLAQRYKINRYGSRQLRQDLFTLQQWLWDNAPEHFSSNEDLKALNTFHAVVEVVSRPRLYQNLQNVHRQKFNEKNRSKMLVHLPELDKWLQCISTK